MGNRHTKPKAQPLSNGRATCAAAECQGQGQGQCEVKGQGDTHTVPNGDCSNGDCSKVDCTKVDCTNGDCSNGDCSNGDCSKVDCSNENCSKVDCSNEDCSKADCSKGDCSKADCSKGDCSNEDCSNGLKRSDSKYSTFGIQYLSDNYKPKKKHKDCKTKVAEKASSDKQQNGHIPSSKRNGFSIDLEQELTRSYSNINTLHEVDDSADEDEADGERIWLKIDEHVDDVTESCVPRQQAVGKHTESDAWLKFDFPFENIVMSGGGSKGYAYIGALKALEDCGALAGVRRVAGSSAGAICGALFAVGLTAQEIADVFLVDIKWLFHDQSCQCCCFVPNVWHKFGVNPGNRFHTIYGEHIAKKTGTADLTFIQLYRRYGRELCIVVTNLNRMCSEYCHWRTTPDLPIRTAVRMSMAFPGVFQSVKIDLHGDGHESYYMDGGTLDQYPIHCFDGPDLELNHNVVTGRGTNTINDRTLGMYVVSESAIDYKIWESLFNTTIPYMPSYLPDTKLARARLKTESKRRKRKNKSFSKKEFKRELSMQFDPEETDVTGTDMTHYETANRDVVDISNFGEFFVTTIETLLISQRKLHVKPGDADRTIPINCGYIGTNDYVIEPGDREFMLRQGYVCTRQYLQEYIKKKHKEQQRLKRNQKSCVSRVPSSYSCGTRSVISNSSVQTDV